ncbi:hypothetical protein AMELA_G00005620 [Ameiurus melas]|uniref:Uncharacterized protein n=1 Tax=Ameiurus melas TaxID=219545 RepID=A0A7J6BI11_AMEME|nr:hypothetical protein AMELA_G00005620 [Ameiurus melas]
MDAPPVIPHAAHRDSFNPSYGPHDVHPTHLSDESFNPAAQSSLTGKRWNVHACEYDYARDLHPSVHPRASLQRFCRGGTGEQRNPTTSSHRTCYRSHQLHVPTQQVKLRTCDVMLRCDAVACCRG